MVEKRYYLFATYMVDSENSIDAIGNLIPDITKRSQGKELALIDIKVQEAPLQAQPGYVPEQEYYEDEGEGEGEYIEEGQEPQQQAPPQQPQEQIPEPAEQE